MVPKDPAHLLWNSGFDQIFSEEKYVAQLKKCRMDKQVEIGSKRAKSAGAKEWRRKRKSEQAEGRRMNDKSRNCKKAG